MATAYEWTAYDYAAKEVLGELIRSAGYSYRQFEEAAGGEMKYSRVRDIELGRRAPVKLSELLVICDVCKVSPVDATRRILDEAARIEDKWKLKQQLSKSLTSASTLTSDNTLTDDDMTAHDNMTAHASTLTHANETNIVPSAAELEAIAAQEQAKRDAVLQQLEDDPYSLAASRSPHKYDPDMAE